MASGVWGFGGLGIAQPVLHRPAIRIGQAEMQVGPSDAQAADAAVITTRARSPRWRGRPV